MTDDSQRSLVSVLSRLSLSEGEGGARGSIPARPLHEILGQYDSVHGMLEGAGTTTDYGMLARFVALFADCLEGSLPPLPDADVTLSQSVVMEDLQRSMWNYQLIPTEDRKKIVESLGRIATFTGIVAVRQIQLCAILSACDIALPTPQSPPANFVATPANMKSLISMLCPEPNDPCMYVMSTHALICLLRCEPSNFTLLHAFHSHALSSEITWSAKAPKCRNGDTFRTHSAVAFVRISELSQDTEVFLASAVDSLLADLRVLRVPHAGDEYCVVDCKALCRALSSTAVPSNKLNAVMRTALETTQYLVHRPSGLSPDDQDAKMLQLSKIMTTETWNLIETVVNMEESIDKIDVAPLIEAIVTHRPQQILYLLSTLYSTHLMTERGRPIGRLSSARTILTLVARHGEPGIQLAEQIFKQHGSDVGMLRRVQKEASKLSPGISKVLASLPSSI